MLFSLWRVSDCEELVGLLAGDDVTEMRVGLPETSPREETLFFDVLFHVAYHSTSIGKKQ